MHQYNIDYSHKNITVLPVLPHQIEMGNIECAAWRGRGGMEKEWMIAYRETSGRLTYSDIFYIAHAHCIPVVGVGIERRTTIGPW